MYNSTSLVRTVCQHTQTFSRQISQIFLLLTFGFFLIACEDGLELAVPENSAGSSIVDMNPVPNTPLDQGFTLPTPDDMYNPPTMDMDPVTMNDLAPIDMMDAMVVVEPPPIPVRAEVKLATMTTAAGIENRISCLAYDENGVIITDPAYIGNAEFDVRPLDGWIRAEDDVQLFTGIQAGEYQVRCQLPQWGLRSEQTPWQVTANAPYRSIVNLSHTDRAAGESATLSCAVFDAWENPIQTQEYSDSLMMNEGDDIPVVEWSMTPSLEDVSLEAGDWSFTRSGEYNFQCTVPGVSESYGAQLFVRPSLPAILQAELDQGKTQYFFNEIVTINYLVKDIYENEIDGAAVAVASTPAMQSFGDRRFLAQTPGTYQIDVTVNDATHQDIPLTESVTIYVDDGAPEIQCTHPTIGAMRSTVPFDITGQVNEVSSLSELTIDGVSVSVDEQGVFSRRVTPTWGLNIHELSARDEFGQVNTALCMFFASDHYLSTSPSAYINDIALLHVSQTAIDDGVPRQPRESFGDLLHAIVNSSELITTIDQALESQNPIVNTSYEIACVPFLGCATATARANYESLAINGSRTIALQLINGGLNIQATFNNLRLDLSTYLNGLGVTIRPSGYVTVDSMSINMNLNVGLSGQVPTVTLRGTPTISVGNIDLSLTINNSVLSAIVNPFTNLVFSLFENLVRNTLVDQMRSYLSTEFDALLSSILGSLDLDALSLDLSLAHPLGTGTIDLNVGFAFNRIEANSTRLRIGLKSNVTGSSVHNRPTPGIATPSTVSPIELTPGVGRDSAAATHVALINTVLYRLWKAGLFDISDVSSLLGNQSGVNITFQTLIPPAIELQSPGTKAKLHFGPALAQVSYPGFFDEPISLYLAAYATAQVSINDQNELSFGNLIIQDLKLSAVDLVLDPEARFALQQTFTNILQSLFDTSLNEALPTLPIPDFALPNSLSQYGIPNNTVLGVRNIRLYRIGQTLQAKGNFGL